MPATPDTRIESLLERVEKPARYIGGETGSITKSGYSCRLVLSYPDVYEIGIANQAVQIIYSIVNHATDAWAERAYCPWPDMSQLMRSGKVPLFSLESWAPVKDADLWGITLQHELTYTNVLEMLDLAGVPLHYEDRTDSDPLVFAGGPCASNPHPVARFFDFMIIGDGEEVIQEIIRVYTGEGRSLSRRELLRRLAAIEGIYVPAFPRQVTRSVVSDLDYDRIPLRPIVPTMHAVHDRATLEVMRGCTRGCRFCLAGNWYRPVRERPAGDVIRAIGEIVDQTGYEEVSLSSLSTTDYSGIKSVLKELAQSHPELTVSLPSLRVDAASLKMLVLTSSRKGSITLAPEAGSQRLRDVVNKQASDNDIYEAITEAFSIGCTTVKLYFMIGLPTETEADLQGIVDIATTARRIGRQTAQSPGRAQVNVSVSSFVPKPHTPFQWDGVNGRTELVRKQDFLKGRMPRKQIKLSLHDIDHSLVEGAIARGGEETAAAIEAAWRAGARFDAWGEKLDFEAWEKGFASIATSVEAMATRSYAVAGPLPWDDVASRVSKEFLVEEQEKAERCEATPDCRWGPCTLCEVCDDDIDMRIVSK